MEDTFEESKNYFNEKLSSQEQSLMWTFNALISDLKAEITKETKSKVSKQHEKLVSQNKILQSRCLNCVNLIMMIRQIRKNWSSMEGAYIYRRLCT